MSSKYKSSSIDWKHIRNPKHLTQMVFGTGLAVVAMKGFMIPNRFLDGGVTGISILLHEILHINISLLMFILNLPFIYLGYKKIGKTNSHVCNVSSICSNNS